MYLNCHSYFSLKYGTQSPEALVENACENDVEILCLTDINNTSAAYTFYTACVAKNIKPLIGIEFRNDDELLYCWRMIICLR